ncbi:dATP pyrophosphohydrolase [Lichenicola cladoniae]|uniref:dATP pyrophosphohydrolase n=1 Tax=Lichenicola cladoniae TaxID=1484109 RepID=A0A6M8HUD3_9PROT|nr:dATP pyrophosphohydrolase [Lichenicola cladoniae]NPD67578.1 dATP pyrophosphohydrolase [Acetobacteraceae bacterium]QKE91777.1 dATP pyrophosphohydrolase [Lichenicola cladoniae]
MSQPVAGTAAAGSIQIVAVRSRADLGRFIRLPDRLFRADPYYVPPLHSERRAALTPKGNPFFGHAEVEFWLAWRDGRVVGRISAQQDELSTNKDAGQFGMLVAIDDPAVFSALIRTAEAWLRARGLRRVQGPFNLSINEEVGLLVDGFDTPPMLMMPHDPPYADARLRELGYEKAQDLYAYLCDTTAALPPAAAKLVGRGLPANVTLRPMRWDALEADIAALVGIFNEAWVDNWSFAPITKEEVTHMSRALRPLLHDRLVWFAEVDGVPAAFGLCLPNLNEAIRDLSGQLFPFGWAKLLWRLKRSGVRSARVPLMGVSRRFDNSLLGRLLPLHIVEAMRREAVAMGITSVEISWVLENNAPMRHLAEAVGGRNYKTYRVYEKTLLT